jgi:hypothetical protein
MPDSRLSKLLKIVRSGAAQCDPRWPAVEESINLKLPGSYKTLIDLFGASSWGNFLQVLSPFDDGRLNFQHWAKQVLDADRVSRGQFPSHYPLPLYPEPGGILPWAGTDNGDALYFITAGPADDWPTVIKGPRSPEFEVSFLSPALLVHHFAAGTLRSTILPQMEG